MKLDEYLRLRSLIIEMGYEDDITWSESILPPATAEAFATEYIFVVCNSGMKAQIAQVIFHKVMDSIYQGEHPSTVFGHTGKANAIWAVWHDRLSWFNGYFTAPDILAYLESMPWIGCITKWHLAKNFGANVVKPDRHLVRVAQMYNMSPQELCESLSAQSGDRVATVDTVIWRACNQKLA